MKLVDRVKQLNKDELIYIGSKSAYFFIGYPDEFLQREKELTQYGVTTLSDFASGYLYFGLHMGILCIKIADVNRFVDIKVLHFGFKQEE